MSDYCNNCEKPRVCPDDCREDPTYKDLLAERNALIELLKTEAYSEC